MSWIDILIVIILAGGLIEGVLRGFIRSVVGVVSVAAGIYFARMFGEDGAAWISDMWDLQPLLSEAISYALIFTIISFAVSLLSRLLGNIIKAAHLNGVNRLLGAIIGLLKGALTTLIIVFAIGRVNEAKTFLPIETCEQSILFQPSYDLANDCLSISRSQFGQTGTDDSAGY